jgi:uncharacterized membrane protein YeaQ/YmgE (transglycosylase-associated protein family)
MRSLVNHAGPDATTNREEWPIMSLEALVLFLLIGLCAGWIAGKIMAGGESGLVGNLIVGVIGAIIGGYLFGLLGISTSGMIGSLVTATVGAVVLLFAIGLIRKGGA